MKSLFSRRSCTAFLIPMALAAVGAFGQDLNRSEVPSGIALSGELFKLAGIGFSMPMPTECNMIYDRFGSIPQGSFFPADRSWQIRVNSVLASDGRLSRVEFMDHQINTELTTFAKTSPDGTPATSQATLLVREQVLNLAIGTASRFYYQYPNIPAPKLPDDWIIRGRTIVPLLTHTGQDAETLTASYLAITLECPEPQFARIRPLYEALVSQATLINPELLSDTRRTKVMAGIAFFSSLTPADFEAIIGDGIDRWEHLVKPKELTGTGEEAEIAFRQLQITSGTLADAPELGGESDPGYLVRLRARSVIEEQNAIIDSNAVFFVSRDFSRETWFVKTAVYDSETGSSRGSAQELGSRSGASMNIRIDGSGVKPTALRPLIEGEGYLSRSLIWILPSLLAHKQTPADYGFYAYNSAANTITFREEALDVDPESASGWRVTSHIAAGQAPQFTYLDGDGQVTRTVLPQGLVWKPIDLPDLFALWEKKGLPTGSLTPNDGR